MPPIPVKEWQPIVVGPARLSIPDMNNELRARMDALDALALAVGNTLEWTIIFNHHTRQWYLDTQDGNVQISLVCAA